MVMDNDVRGWVLTAISGIACFFGANLICVDVLVRRFPGMQDFKITESDAFLSASLSLSAGVILFSSLNSMLPASKNYFMGGGYTAKQASFLIIGIFLAGVFGIRILSQVLHRLIPSHVVECDHTHDEEAVKHQHEEMTEHDYEEHHIHDNGQSKVSEHEDGYARETTPLISGTTTPRGPQRTTTAPAGSITKSIQTNGFVTAPNSRRSSLFPRSLSRTFSRVVSSRKGECDEDGPCMGYSDPCGSDCFKIVQRRGTQTSLHPHSRLPTWQRLSSHSRHDAPVIEGNSNSSESHIDQQASLQEGGQHDSASNPPFLDGESRSRSATHHYHHPEHESEQVRSSSQRRPSQAHSQVGTTDHHHHVPTNAFLSIGLQTSIAIALHKAPEGFITYATNHANPKLGLTVFIALFIHNISEGFALSLPLFLALNSRVKAIFWSSILGGLSQPFGAGIAALWFKLAGHSQLAPNEKVYGGIFAVTAGIMASVGLSLLSESLQLSHNKNTCLHFAFVGMGILGVSMAFNA